MGQLQPVALANQRVFYRLLFRAAAETLLEVAVPIVNSVGAETIELSGVA